MIETDVALELKKTHHKISEIMQQKIDEYGLTFGLLHLMMLIEKNPDANQKELAEEMRFTQGAMSIAVKRLLKLSMLEQTPMKVDARYNRLVVTEMGKAMIGDYKSHLLNRYKNMFSDFSHNELEKLYEFLLKINMNLDYMNNTSNMKNLKE